MNDKQSWLAMLPSIDHLLGQSESMELIKQFSHTLTKETITEALKKIRQMIINGEAVSFETREDIIHLVLRESMRAMEKIHSSSLKTVINATGIILHTGLGRAPYSKAAQKRVSEVMSGYCNLEFDLESGDRGERNDHISDLLCRLTGAEAGIMVNNNAAAVLLTLNALCFSKEVIVSRGQLIEIGGSFRLPDVMSKSGAIMKEVGATNKTRINDYASAINADTGAIFVAHTSNYRVLGFTEEPDLSALTMLAHENKIPLIHDLGGGVFVDLRRFNLPYEPLVQDSLKAGVDIISFSGDKVLGGPQAGVIVGKQEYIERIHQDPIMRAVRCDKLTFAAMEATLKLYFQDTLLQSENKTLFMLRESVEQVHTRAQQGLSLLDIEIKKRYQIMLETSDAQAGSGALPLEKLPSWSIVLTPPQKKAQMLAQRLRMAKTPVVGYVTADRVYLDMRTVSEEELPILAQVVNAL